MLLGSVTHLQGIAVCKIGRNVAVVSNWNVRPLLSELDVISIVVEAMRKETHFRFSTARHDGKQHEAPLGEMRYGVFYKPRGRMVRGKACGKM
jgi:hypothetical protein